MRLELTDDQRALRASVRQFADAQIAPRATDSDVDNRFPHDLVREAGARGFMGVTIPVADGGAGPDYVSYALAIEEIARTSAVRDGETGRRIDSRAARSGSPTARRTCSWCLPPPRRTSADGACPHF